MTPTLDNEIVKLDQPHQLAELCLRAFKLREGSWIKDADAEGRYSMSMDDAIQYYHPGANYHPASIMLFYGSNDAVDWALAQERAIAEELGIDGADVGDEVRYTKPHIDEVFRLVTEFNSKSLKVVMERSYGGLKKLREAFRKDMVKLGIGGAIDWTEE